MKPYLQMFCDHGGEHGRELARNLCIRSQLITRVTAYTFEWDLNPHLQVKHVVDQVIADVTEEGFPEVTREDVYLLWLTSKVFGENDGL